MSTITHATYLNFLFKDASDSLCVGKRYLFVTAYKQVKEVELVEVTKTYTKFIALRGSGEVEFASANVGYLFIPMV